MCEPLISLTNTHIICLVLEKPQIIQIIQYLNISGFNHSNIQKANYLLISVYDEVVVMYASIRQVKRLDWPRAVHF